jgi:hypothetical protein
MAQGAAAPAIAWDDEAPQGAKPGPQIVWDSEKQDPLDAALRTGKGIEKFTAQATTAVPGGKTAGAVLPRVETARDRNNRELAAEGLVNDGAGGVVFTDPKLQQMTMDLGAASPAGHQMAADTDAAMASRANRGRGPTWSDRANSFGMHALASATDLAAGMTSPSGVATTGAAMIAPEVTLPYLAAKGGARMADHAPGVFRLPNRDESALNPLSYLGNPDEVEPFLQGGAQVAGSVAGTGEAIRPGFTAARAEGASVPRAIERGFQETRTGRAVTAINRNVVQPIAERVTPPPAPKALRQAIQPGINIPRAGESIDIFGPRAQQVLRAGGLTDRTGEPLTEIKSPAQLVDATKGVKAHILDKINERLGPISDLARVDTSPIADAMEKSIAGRTERQFAGEAKTIRDRAATYRGQMTLGELESSIQDANDDLKGFYQRSGASSAPTSAGMRATLAEVKMARQMLDSGVEDLRGAGLKDLKREYGAARDVERAATKAEFVTARQKGMPLYEALAALRAAGDFVTGNVLGAAKGAATIAMGKYLTKLRDPNFLIEQAFHGREAFQPATAIAKPPIDVAQGEFVNAPGRRGAGTQAPMAGSPQQPQLPARPGQAQLPARGVAAGPMVGRPQLPKHTPGGVTVMPSSGETFVPGARRALPPANPIDLIPPSTPRGGVRTSNGIELSPEGDIMGRAATATEAVGQQHAAPAQTAQPPRETQGAQTAQSAAAQGSAEQALNQKLQEIGDKIGTATSKTQIRKLLEQRQEVQKRLDAVRKTGTAKAKSGSAGPSVFERYKPEVIEEARQELEHASRMWGELPEPGRTRVVEDDEGNPLPPRSQTWVGTSSPRGAVEDMYPWVKNETGGLADLQEALRRGTGAAYERWLESAADFVAKQNQSSE